MAALLFIPVVLWSFVGVLVKEASASFSPAVISVGRFFFGVVFLAVWFLARGRRPRLNFSLWWVWAAAAAKTLNYICENIPMVRGHSWGYIVEQPVQALSLLLFSVIIFRERLGWRSLLAACLCLIGVVLVASRGLGSAAETAVADIVLFVIAAVGSSVHFMFQKTLMTKMDSGSMNFSVFLLASGMSALALPFAGPLLVGPIGLSAAAALVALGVVTGAGFLIWAALAKNVPFLVSGVIANTLSIFALIWGVSLRGEPVAPAALVGVVIFLSGLILMKARPAKPKIEKRPI